MQRNNEGTKGHDTVFLSSVTAKFERIIAACDDKSVIN
jgi:hypothetical protein